MLLVKSPLLLLLHYPGLGARGRVRRAGRQDGNSLNTSRGLGGDVLLRRVPNGRPRGQLSSRCVGERNRSIAWAADRWCVKVHGGLAVEHLRGWGMQDDYSRTSAQM